MATQKFYYTCINKYLPLMYIAFYIKSYIKLFSTLITLMVIDQLKDTLGRWLKSLYKIMSFSVISL